MHPNETCSQLMVHPSLSTESTCLAGKGVHSGQGDPAGERGMAEYLEDLSNPSSGHLPGSGLLTAPQTRQPHIPAHLLPTSEPTDQRGLRSACTIPLCSDGQAGTALNHEERREGRRRRPSLPSLVALITLGSHPRYPCCFVLIKSQISKPQSARLPSPASQGSLVHATLPR